LLPEPIRQTLSAKLPGKEPLYQIALQCGYTNHSHFASRFRLAYGTSPSEMRNGTHAA
jgi:AraC-like DNA-binding protein